MSHLIRCPNCQNQVEQSNYCKICGGKIQSPLNESHYSNKEKESKIIINQKSGFISGLSQGMGCVVGILLTILIVLFLIFKGCESSSSLFNVNTSSANRNAVLTDLNNLGEMAMHYYKTPTAMAGGGNTFTGWKIPTTIKTTYNGTYTVTVKAQSITIVGVGIETGDDSKKNVKATATVTPTTITSVKNN